MAERRGLCLVVTPDLTDAEPTALSRVDPWRRAMLMYTSGTTSKPKGAVTTHDNIAAQVQRLVEACGSAADDHIDVRKRLAQALISESAGWPGGKGGKEPGETAATGRAVAPIATNPLHAHPAGHEAPRWYPSRRRKCLRRKEKPALGFEPRTSALRKPCSAIELRWLRSVENGPPGLLRATCTL